MESFFRENGIFVASTIFMIGLIVSANMLSQKGNLDYTYQPSISSTPTHVANIPTTTASPSQQTDDVVAVRKQLSVATNSTTPKTATIVAPVKPAVRHRGNEGSGDDN